LCRVHLRPLPDPARLVLRRVEAHQKGLELIGGDPRAIHRHPARRRGPGGGGRSEPLEEIVPARHLDAFPFTIEVTC
jgi:hypothetical protein